ncbi:MAG: chromosome partitioning protein ParB [Deltaproteobacteria bacterium]|nr:chromosome partitioning protein ParB [Deltaproteobacteria bacterium]
MSKLFLLLTLALLAAPLAGAKEPFKSEYDSLSEGQVAIKKNRVYRIHVEDLRPTQFGVGRAEIRSRLEEINAMDKDEFRKYLKEKVGSVVIGPGGEYYLVDGHHLASALTMDGRKEMLVRVLDDWSRLTPENFFKRMIKEKRLWPFDEHGNGPKDPSTLPRTIRGLHDDPFRSLAYRVRKAGGFEDLTVPFQEFYWANYFRRFISVEELHKSPKKAIEKAVELAGDLEARKLPGFIPNKKCEKLLKGK